MFFVAKLVSYLDVEDPEWRENTVLMVDNAPYHRSKAVRAQIQALCLPLLFLGPYHYKMAPIEHAFAFIKSRDLHLLGTRAQAR